MQEIKMPSAGQTTDEATIVTVNVKVGDTVKRGDVLCEAETDKAVLPVESFAAGQVFDVLVKEGDKVNAGSVLVVVGKAADAAKYARGGAADRLRLLPLRLLPRLHRSPSRMSTCPSSRDRLRPLWLRRLLRHLSATPFIPLCPTPR